MVQVLIKIGLYLIIIFIFLKSSFIRELEDPIRDILILAIFSINSIIFEAYQFVQTQRQWYKLRILWENFIEKYRENEHEERFIKQDYSILIENLVINYNFLFNKQKKKLNRIRSRISELPDEGNFGDIIILGE